MASADLGPCIRAAGAGRTDRPSRRRLQGREHGHQTSACYGHRQSGSISVVSVSGPRPRGGTAPCEGKHYKKNLKSSLLRKTREGRLEVVLTSASFVQAHRGGGDGSRRHGRVPAAPVRRSSAHPCTKPVARRGRGMAGVRAPAAGFACKPLGTPVRRSQQRGVAGNNFIAARLGAVASCWSTPGAGTSGSDRSVARPATSRPRATSPSRASSSRVRKVIGRPRASLSPWAGA